MDPQGGEPKSDTIPHPPGSSRRPSGVISVLDSAATLVLIGSEAKTLSKPAREVWGLSHRFLFGERLSSEITISLFSFCLLMLK